MPVLFGTRRPGVTASASFSVTSPALPDSLGCMTKERLGALAAVGHRVTPLDAGQVTLSTGLLQAATLQRSELFGYTFATDRTTYGPGSLLTYRASGGQVPPIEVSVVAPPAVQMVEPACRQARPPRCDPSPRLPDQCPSRCAPAFDRTRDLVVRWAPTFPGVMRVFVYSSGGKVIDVALPCVFDSQAGAGVVESSMLALNGPDLLVLLAPEARTVMRRGDLVVTAGASGARVERVFADQ